MLTKAEIDKYEKRLLAQRRKIFDEIKADRAKLDFGSDVDNFDEETDEAEETGNELAVERVLKERIIRIDMALNKITMGTYGICEKCNAEIHKKILDVAPESSFCQKCKKAK